MKIENGNLHGFVLSPTDNAAKNEGSFVLYSDAYRFIEEILEESKH